MNATEKYCKAVAKELVCSKATKKAFIAALKEDLANSNSAGSIPEIEANHGTPQQTAEDFQQNISAEERAKALHKNKIVKWVCMMLCTVLVGLSIFAVRYGIFSWSHSVSTYEIEITEG